MQNKRGLSIVVTTLILILLVLVAVGVVWVVVKNIVSEGAEEISLGKFTINLEIKSVKTNETSNNVSIIIKRNTGKGDLTGIKFIFENKTVSESKDANTSLQELEEKEFDFHLEELDVSDIEKVSIASLFKSESEREFLGDILDEHNIKKPGSESSSCIPDCAGKECGDDGCGGECGSCSADESCVNNLCIINCADSDNGIDYFTKGLVVSELYPSGKSDYCHTFSPNNIALFEGNCVNNAYVRIQKNCAELGNYVCVDGACV